MNVSAWSISHPLPVVLFFLVTGVLGAVSFYLLDVEQFMDVQLPTVTVNAVLPGATPEQLEKEVAEKIETSVASISGIKHLYTKIKSSTVTITVEFRLEKDVDEAVADVREAVSSIRSALPSGLVGPNVSRVKLSEFPILKYAVISDRSDVNTLTSYVDDVIIKELTSIRGVGAVNRIGGSSREIHVELDPVRLLAHGITAAEVSQQLKLIRREASGGKVSMGGNFYSVRLAAEARSVRGLAESELVGTSGRHIRLKDVAEVKDVRNHNRFSALLNNDRVVGFEVIKSRSYGELYVANNIREKLDKLRQENPKIDIVEVYNLVDHIEENFRGSLLLLLEGALLVVIVVWLFVRNARATFIASIALPLSIVPTFAAMYYLDFSLNMVTLLSLSLVVGVLVDDAIVETENIIYHLNLGKAPIEAAIDATNEISLAVIATSATLIAVFLPTAFMGGVPGKFFVQFGWTASIAVFFSLLVARLMIPIVAAWLLVKQDLPRSEPLWIKRYLGLVDWSLNNRLSVLVLTILFFGSSFYVLPMISKGFIPPDDISQTTINIILPSGTGFDSAMEIAGYASNMIMKTPYVADVFASIGDNTNSVGHLSHYGETEVSSVIFDVRLLPRSDRKGFSKSVIEQYLREKLSKIPGVKYKVGTGGGGQKYILVLSGEDGQKLLGHAAVVEGELRSIPGIGNVISSASLARPEVVVRPDLAKAADLGVTTTSIATALRVATVGDYVNELAKLNLPSGQLPVVVKLSKEFQGDLDFLGQIRVSGRNGLVPIKNVASFGVEPGAVVIDRYDQFRNINFEIDTNQLILGEVDNLLKSLPSIQNMPSNIKLTTAGDAEAFRELFSSFGFAMLAGLLCIYVVLTLLFHDFLQPVTILIALVLSVPGALFALFVTNSQLSVPSMIGMIMLMGIATKNSILLIDYILIARCESGMDRYQAVTEACKRRARPIIMTTIAMAGGMMPIALGFGADSSFRAPMAFVVIGGVVTSTFLSLLVVPVVYTYMDDIFFRFKNTFGVGRGRVMGVQRPQHL